MTKHKPYPKYKPSGIDWIGDIPEGWEKERLKYWVNLINEPEESEVEKFLVDLENIESFTGKLLNEIESSGKGMKRFVSGDVLFNKLRPYLAKVFYGGKDGCCGGEFLVLRPKNEIVPKFLFYRVLSIDFINLINNSSYGVKMPRANWDYIGSIFLPYPNQKEQRDIVSYLDQKTAQIDDLIQKKEEMIKLLKEKRAAIINQAVTKGLDPNAKMKSSGVDWIGDIPEGWKIERLKYWVDLINEPEESEDEKLLVDLDNIESFTGKLLNETEGSGKGMKMFATGDVLLNKLRPYLAKVFYGEKYGCCGGELLVLRPKDKIVPKFLFYRVLSIDFINLINNSSYGVKMSRANWDYIGSVVLPYSNKQEQQAIVCYLDSKTEEIDSLIKKIESAIAKLREYRSSLITATVTGKIDVRG